MIYQLTTTTQAKQRYSFFANNQSITITLNWNGYLFWIADEIIRKVDPSGITTDVFYKVQQDITNNYAPAKFYADIQIGTTYICKSQRVVNRQPIMQYTSDLIGNIYIINTENNDDPNLFNIGKTAFLYYSDTPEEVRTV